MSNRPTCAGELKALRRTYQETRVRSAKLGCVAETIRLIEETNPGIDEGQAVDAAMIFLRTPLRKEQRT